MCMNLRRYSARRGSCNAVIAWKETKSIEEKQLIWLRAKAAMYLHKRISSAVGQDPINTVDLGLLGQKANYLEMKGDASTGNLIGGLTTSIRQQKTANRQRDILLQQLGSGIVKNG